MSFLPMGLSCGDHSPEKRESEELLDDGNRRQGSMNMEVEFDGDFWPVEHPMEPQDEDRPVKCPIPTSSVINEGKYAESLRGRPTVVNKKGIVIVAAESAPVRKRHHSLAHGDEVIKPLTRTPSLPPLPSHNATIFHMLHHIDEFGC